MSCKNEEHLVFLNKIMEALAKSQRKGVPDTPHEVGIPDYFNSNVKEVLIIREALNDERFLECATYQQQIEVLRQLLSDEDGNNIIPYTRIGHLFVPPVSPRAITKRLEKEHLSNGGRPLLITDAECQQISDAMQKQCREQFPSVADVASFIAKNFDMYPSVQTIRNLFHENRISNFHFEEASPIEEAR